MQDEHLQVITTNGTTAAYPLDKWTNGYGISVTFSNTTMTATYTLQYSMLDPYCSIGRGNAYTNSYKVSGNWQNSDDPVMVAQSASRSSNFAYPPRALRLVTSNVSGGSLTLSIVPKTDDGG